VRLFYSCHWLKTGKALNAKEKSENLLPHKRILSIATFGQKSTMKYKVALISLLSTVVGYPCAGTVIAVPAAQDSSAHLLPEVTVQSYIPQGTSAAEKYSVGTQVLHFNNAALVPVQHFNLSDYLQTQTAIHFKEYGKGMQSTMSLRGTAASHVAVRWNGFNVNFTTMGESNFNHLPLFFFDDVKVHAGGESVLYGSGAMGGSVELLTVPQFNNGLHAEVRQTVGSYGYTFTGGVLRWSGNRWESRTSLLYTQADNHYTYANTQTPPPHRRDTLNNAAYRNWGVLQEVYYHAGVGLLSARIWYMDFYREVQPLISSVETNKPYDDIYDRNFRALVNYSGAAGKIKWNAQAGYAYDYERFHTDIIAAGKLLQGIEGEYEWRRVMVKVGINSEYIRPRVDAYEGGSEEWRNDVFVQARWTPTARWVVSGGLRQSFVTSVQVPVAPSLGAAYTVLRNEAHEVKGRVAFSRNIKIPSLNDRYWGTSHTYLKPEIGLEGEAGLDYTFTNTAWNIAATGNVYYNRVSDWIRWLQSKPIGTVQQRDIWRPVNVGVVDCYGVELFGHAHRQWQKTAVHVSAGYAYTPVIMRQGTRPGDSGVGQQAPYQPLHVVHASVKPSYGKAFVQVDMRYVGDRHTTDIFDVLPPYLLIDLSGGYTFPIGKSFLSALLQINNVGNIDYQNMKNYAMPGINYNFTCRFNF
jgi:iron complex outermembrane receptor protein